MNKAELISTVASSIDCTKGVAAASVEAIFEALAVALAGGDKVTIVGFGTFSVSERAAREGYNPATQAVMQIAAKNIVKFKPGKELKERVAK